MPYCLDQINQAVRQDPAAFMAAGDAAFHEKVCRAADLIQSHRDKSPVVLLSGPSGSGKTTTAGMINAELERRGIHTHTISMDDYFLTPDPSTAPRTPDGEMDFESPLMLDLALLDDHFSRLARGEEILVPHFEFARRMRNDSQGTPLRLGPDEVAIFEGIHALNTTITGKHPEATRLYISARSDVVDGEGKVCFKGTWMRLTRRAVRDYNFRGTDIAATLDKVGSGKGTAQLPRQVDSVGLVEPLFDLPAQVGVIGGGAEEDHPALLQKGLVNLVQRKAPDLLQHLPRPLGNDLRHLRCFT